MLHKRDLDLDGNPIPTHVDDSFCSSLHVSRKSVERHVLARMCCPVVVAPNRVAKTSPIHEPSRAQHQKRSTLRRSLAGKRRDRNARFVSCNVRASMLPTKAAFTLECDWSSINSINHAEGRIKFRYCTYDPSRGNNNDIQLVSRIQNLTGQSL